jgi:hypothetical protein
MNLLHSKSLLEELYDFLALTQVWMREYRGSKNFISNFSQTFIRKKSTPPKREAL